MSECLLKPYCIMVFFLLIGLFVLTVFLFLQQAKFGKLPSGKRLDRIKQSPHYKNGKFQNLSHTPDLTEGVGYYEVTKDFFFGKKERIAPTATMPSVKTDLHHLDPQKDVLVWFGHSSYFMQIDGKRLLVDPVFCGFASPFSFSIKAFDGTDIYTVADMPTIDYLLISHDHWDHLDYQTIKALNPKIKTVICGLGVGEHLEHWGYAAAKIIEKDWNETVVLADGFTVHTVPARHFSGRGVQRNKALWQSYVLQTPTLKIFIGGDSGYDSHFKEIGQKFGPFDLAILENGQYDRKWRYIHMMPNEILNAATELKAKRILPVHSAKFALASHAWDAPLAKIVANNKSYKLDIITPMIGEEVRLKEPTQTFENWWESV